MWLAWPMDCTPNIRAERDVRLRESAPVVGDELVEDGVAFRSIVAGSSPRVLPDGVARPRVGGDDRQGVVSARGWPKIE